MTLEVPNNSHPLSKADHGQLITSVLQQHLTVVPPQLLPVSQMLRHLSCPVSILLRSPPFYLSRFLPYL